MLELVLSSLQPSLIEAAHRLPAKLHLELVLGVLDSDCKLLLPLKLPRLPIFKTTTLTIIPRLGLVSFFHQHPERFVTGSNSFPQCTHHGDR